MNKENIIRVMLLRKDELNPDEYNRFKEKFPRSQIETFRCDPKNYHEHTENCEKLKPDFIILPMDRPIPSEALERGFRHVFSTSKGLEELKSIHIESKPF